MAEVTVCVSNDKPTVAGVLLFSDEPQAALPKRSAIKVFRYATKEEGVDRETLAFDPLTIEGLLYDLVEKAVSTTKEIVQSIKRVGETGLEEVSYPDETLHEIITNAVLHRATAIRPMCRYASMMIELKSKVRVVFLDT